MYLSQINILEEENAAIKGKLQEQKERYQEALEDARSEIEGIKDQFKQVVKAGEERELEL